MVLTLDEFKQAFAGTSGVAASPKASRPPAGKSKEIDQRVAAIVAVLKELQEAVAALKKAKRKEEPFKTDLTKLTEALKRAKDSSDPDDDKLKQLEKLEKLAKQKLEDAKVAAIDLENDPKAGAKLMKALEARYGIDFELEEGVRTEKMVDGKKVIEFPGRKLDPKEEAETLKHMYDVLAKAPVFPNSHLTKITTTLMPHKDADSSEGGWYAADKTVGIECNRPKHSLPTELNERDAFPDRDVDENCQPANPKKTVKYFDWATLHEVGHAVDAKHGFMKNKGGTFGGWKEIKKLDTVAAACAEKYKDKLTKDDGGEAGLKKYALDLLNGGTTAPATDAQKLAKKWVEMVSESGDQWWYGDKCKKSEVGGTVYQESYAGEWWSYPIASRKQGISGYQFRAPWEWFAELYAAKYTDKMKKAHPFWSELEKLEKE